ncbi:hypothetical protein LINPERHAP1_LOCUS26082 [Linum perenne]
MSEIQEFKIIFKHSGTLSNELSAQTIASNCLSIQVVLQSSHAAADSLLRCVIPSYSLTPIFLVFCIVLIFFCVVHVVPVTCFPVSSVSKYAVSSSYASFFILIQTTPYTLLIKKDPFTLSIPLIPVRCGLEGRRRVVQRKMVLFAGLFYIPSTGLELCNYNDFRESWFFLQVFDEMG